jgi:hypothetical protein
LIEQLPGLTPDPWCPIRQLFAIWRRDLHQQHKNSRLSRQRMHELDMPQMAD